MPTIHIGRRELAKLPVIEKTTIFYDRALKGFGLKVTPSGVKSWLVEYRPGEGGRAVAKRRMVFGDPETFSPEKARTHAEKLLARVKLGEDPAGDRNKARRGATVAELLDFYMDEKIRVFRKPRTADFFDRLIRNHLAPALGARKANSVIRADVIKLHRAIGKEHQTAANRALTVLGAAFTYGTKAGVLPEDFRNPARGVERFKENARERYLSADELSRLGEALRLAETTGLPWAPDPNKKLKHAPKPENRRVRIDPFAVAALRLLLFTGARLREILHLRWEWVDLERGLLRLPDSKTGAKTIVLGAAAMAVLAGLPRVGSYCFPGARRGKQSGGMPDQPRSDLNRPWARIAKHAGLEGVRIHDLRHSFASVATGSGLGLPIIGKLLGHMDAATTSRYAHLADDPLRRAAGAVSNTIAAALEGRGADTVVELRKDGAA